jgi:hypothetical protein
MRCTRFDLDLGEGKRYSERLLALAARICNWLIYELTESEDDRVRLEL